MTSFLLEWKHFVRNPFKVLALILFVLAGIYSLQTGANLYHRQIMEIEGINQQIDEDRQQNLAYFEKGEKGPADRPWVDLTTPFWALWYTPVYHFKSPSPTMVFSTGQAEQYGFYKRITFRSNPYDADMVEEIANPERLQVGTLDFSFVLLYLMPLLLLIWVYNIKGSEADAGFLPLIYTQTGATINWLVGRISFYALVMMMVVLGLMIYGALLTDVFSQAADRFGQIFLLTIGYLLLWLSAYGLILYFGKSSIGNTLQMVGLWLLLAFIMPAAVHQWVTTQYPPNLMTDLIDVKREEQEKLFDQPDSILQAKLDQLFPEIIDSPVAKDSTRKNFALNRSGAALTNELMKGGVTDIEAGNVAKNRLIQSSYWINPIGFFQNRLNFLTQTHFEDYLQYRDEVQSLVDIQIRTLVLDTWNAIPVNKDRYLEYREILNP